ncbi:hypothetical protein STANM309S_01926 [Streptomyces tanashiensis]
MSAARRTTTVRRKALAVGAVTLALATGLAGCSGSAGTATKGSPGGTGAKKGPAAAPQTAPRLIGDGSTAFTGAQPHQPVWKKLEPGETPPQFVVFSWDGAGEDSQKLFSHFRSGGQEDTTPP